MENMPRSLQLRLPTEVIDLWHSMEDNSILDFETATSLSGSNPIDVSSSKQDGWFDITIKDVKSNLLQRLETAWKCELGPLVTVSGKVLRHQPTQPQITKQTPVADAGAKGDVSPDAAERCISGNDSDEDDTSQSNSGDRDADDDAPKCPVPQAASSVVVPQGLTADRLAQLRCTDSGLFCFICSYTTTRRNRNYLRKHLIMKHKVDFSAYRAALTLDDNTALLRLHEMKTESLRWLKQRDAKRKALLRGKVKQLPVCDDCGTTFPTKKFLIRHMYHEHQLNKDTGDTSVSGNEKANAVAKRRKCLKVIPVDKSNHRTTKGKHGPGYVDKGEDNEGIVPSVSKSNPEEVRLGEIKREGDNEVEERNISSRLRTRKGALEKRAGAKKTTVKKANKGLKKIAEAKTESKSSPAPEACLLCGEVMSKLWNVLRHAKMVHFCSTAKYKRLRGATGPERETLRGVLQAEEAREREEQQEEAERSRGTLHEESLQGKIVCPVCGKVYVDVRSAVNHVFSLHQHLPDFKDVLLKVDEMKNNKGKAAGGNGGDGGANSSGGGVGGGLSVKCPYCDVARTSKNIISHLRLCHTSEADLEEKIRQVDDSVDEQSILLRRLKDRLKEKERVRNGQLWHCKFCEKPFTHRRSKSRHQDTCARNPEPVRRFVCTVCGKHFPTRDEMVAHKEEHGQKNFICDLCGKAYKNRSGVIIHRRSFHGLANKYEINFHECQHCDRKFYEKSKWRKHVYTHSDERAYCCEYCGKQFKTRDNVKEHQKIVHFNKYPFHCEKCGHGVNRQLYLEKHICGNVKRVQPQERVSQEAKAPRRRGRRAATACVPPSHETAADPTPGYPTGVECAAAVCGIMAGPVGERSAAAAAGGVAMGVRTAMGGAAADGTAVSVSDALGDRTRLDPSGLHMHQHPHHPPAPLTLSLAPPPPPTTVELQVAALHQQQQQQQQQHEQQLQSLAVAHGVHDFTQMVGPLGPAGPIAMLVDGGDPLSGGVCLAPQPSVSGSGHPVTASSSASSSAWGVMPTGQLDTRNLEQLLLTPQYHSLAASKDFHQHYSYPQQ